MIVTAIDIDPKPYALKIIADYGHGNKSLGPVLMCNRCLSLDLGSCVLGLKSLLTIQA